MSRHAAKNGRQTQSSCAMVSCTHPENKMKILAVGLLLLLICSSTQGVLTSCEDVSVYLDDPVNITCHFSEDINQTRSGDIRIYKYDLYSSGTEKGVLVLDCYWKDGAVCKTTEEGYTFVGTVSNRLTVAISRADENSTGKYECQVLPTDSSSVNQCRLTLKAGVKPTPSPVPTTSATTTEADSEGEEDTNAAAIAVPIILLIIIAAVIVVAVIFRKKILTSFPFLTRIPALTHFWRTPEDGTPGVPIVTTHDENPAGSRKLLANNPTEDHSVEQLRPETENNPLLSNEQSASVSSTDFHSSERPGGQLPKQEEEDKWYDTTDKHDEVDPDIDGVESFHIKLSTQATDETENNKTLCTNANFEEAHSADDSCYDDDNKNTEEHAAFATGNGKEKDKYDDAKSKEIIKHIGELGNFDNYQAEGDSEKQIEKTEGNTVSDEGSKGNTDDDGGKDDDDMTADRV